MKTVKIMEKGETVEIDGTLYEADLPESGCRGCAAFDETQLAELCIRLPNCGAVHRIIFKKVIIKN
jgi:hypothetical protein